MARADDDASRDELIVRGACDRLGESGIGSEPSLRERILGDVTSTVITESPRPVLIVRNRSGS